MKSILEIVENELKQKENQITHLQNNEDVSGIDSWLTDDPIHIYFQLLSDKVMHNTNDIHL